MAYIGAKPVNGFFKKQDLTTDGSTTTFSLDFTVGSTTAILVSVGGVVQEPDVAYNLSGGGTSIVFTEAPASTADTYVHFLGQAIVQNITDVNGTEFILDVDADTSLTADTDDQIDIKVGGADQVKFVDGGIIPSVDDDVDLGSNSLKFKDLYIDGTAQLDAANVNGSAVVNVGDAQTLTGAKTLQVPLFQDNSDTSKKVTFSMASIGTSTTRTFTFPNANTTFVGTDTTDTLTNKTLTSPTIAKIIGGGTNTTGHVVPNLADDTFALLTATQTLTNKTIDAGTY